MKNFEIDELKKDYSENVVDTAVLNILSLGKENVEKQNMKDCIQTLSKVFETLETEKKFFPVTQDFLTKVLNCQFYLLNVDDVEILTYFSKKIKGE